MDKFRVIQLLVQHSSDRFIECSIGKEKWSPLKIARYSLMNEAIITLIKNGVDMDGNEGDVVQNSVGEVIKAAYAYAMIAITVNG